MMGIGVFSLLILRSMIRSIPPVATSPVVALEETISSSNSLSTSPPETEGADNDSGNPDSGNPELFLHRRATTSTIRDELAEVVRDDPEAAAKVLSTWIGNAE